MKKQADMMRQTAAELLKSGKVEMVIGFEGEESPRPAFIEKTEDAARLVWNERCAPGLARYLVKAGKKAAIVAKGCDVRALAGLIREKQVKRDDVVILGIDCAFQTAGGEKLPQCLVCTCRRPEMHDVLIDSGTALPEPPADDFPEVKEFQSFPTGERLGRWRELMGRCLRCYACRQACPLCYCEECAAEQSLPRWLPRAPDENGNLFFHLMRAHHLAGRCVDCGACERACPVKIPLRLINRAMIKEIAELYGWRPNADPEALPPLATFRPDDPGGEFK